MELSFQLEDEVVAMLEARYGERQSPPAIVLSAGGQGDRRYQAMSKIRWVSGSRFSRRPGLSVGYQPLDGLPVAPAFGYEVGRDQTAGKRKTLVPQMNTFFKSHFTFQ
ncbi:hypothetical protein HS088_TW18G01151 [Tripterygium wilfordii]|uniref:Uncharacterized protein n=1 Tax=Tripterygium wilfordii TaxID=458696 RepID=A0A7J7CFG9_TRIWF|nr:hypothetical protein HS088_TW18G01151 [Tripterygium wilfordii]